jgi:hypothetical protein
MTQRRFRATLTEPQPKPVLVRYRTQADSAVADVDFLPAEGEATIPGRCLAPIRSIMPIAAA